MRAMLIAILMLAAVSAQAAPVLVWDRDSNETLNDPLGAGMVGTEFAVVRALQALGHQVTTVSSLPVDLSGYDAILVLTSWGC